MRHDVKRHRQPLIAMGQESMGCGEMSKDRGKRLSDCAGKSMGCGKTLMGFGKAPIDLGGTSMNFGRGR